MNKMLGTSITPIMMNQVRQRYVRARQQDQISAGDRGDRATGADDRCAAGQDITDSRSDSAGQIKREISPVADAVVDVVPEDVEEQHVPADVQEVGMQELIGEIIQQLQMPRVERPRRAVAGPDDLLKNIYPDVDADQHPVHVRGAVEPAVSA